MDANSKQSREDLAQRNVQNAVTSLEAKQAQDEYKKKLKEKAEQQNSNLWQHPFVDVFKHFKLLPGSDWKQNKKAGDVTEYFVSSSFYCIFMFYVCRPKKQVKEQLRFKERYQLITSYRCLLRREASSHLDLQGDTYIWRSSRQSMGFRLVITLTLAWPRGLMESEYLSATCSRTSIPPTVLWLKFLLSSRTIAGQWQFLISTSS